VAPYFLAVAELLNSQLIENGELRHHRVVKYPAGLPTPGPMAKLVQIASACGFLIVYGRSRKTAFLRPFPDRFFRFRLPVLAPSGEITLVWTQTYIPCTFDITSEDEVRGGLDLLEMGEVIRFGDIDQRCLTHVDGELICHPIGACPSTELMQLDWLTGLPKVDECSDD